MNLPPKRRTYDYRIEAMNTSILNGNVNNYGGDGLKQAYPQWFNPSDSFLKVARSQYNPAAIMMWDATSIYILIEGLQTLEQANRMVLGWYSQAFGNPAPLWDKSSAIAMDNIYRGLNLTDDFLRARGVRIAGHSWGGLVACILAVKIRGDLGFSFAPEVSSYGAPRGYVGRYTSLFNFAAYNRTVITNDPVTCCPPHLNEGVAYVGQLPAVASQTTQTMAHPQGGFSIDGVGFVVPVDENHTQVRNEPVELAAWVFGTNLYGSSNHAIAEYDRRMQLGLSTYDTLDVPPTTQAVEQIIRPTTTVERRIVTQAVAAQASALSVNVPATVNSVLTTTPPKLNVKYKSYSNKYGRYVRYDGQIVCACVNRRAQKKLVRDLNRGRISIPPPPEIG